MSSDPILESHRKRLQQHREFLGNTSGSKDGNFQASQEKPLPPMNRTDIPSRAHKDSANEQSKPKDGSYLSDASGILHVSYHHGNNELNSSTSPRDAGEVMEASRPTLIEHSHPNKNLNAHFSTSQGNESNSYPPASSGRTFSSSVPADGALRVCMRGQRWARIREENLHRQRQAALEEQLRECTFSPCLSDSLTNDGARIPPDSTHLHKGNPSQYSDSNKDGDRSQERMIDRLLGLEPTPEFQSSYSPADWAPHGLNEYDSDPGQTRGYLYTQNPPGFEDYIERQEEARRRRNACLARQTIRTDKWCNRVTVPVPFHIGEPISVRLSSGGKNDSVQRSPRKESPLSLEQPFHDELCLVQNSTIRIPKDMTTATSRSQALRAFEDIVRTGLVASDASNDDATRKPYVSRDTRHAQNKVHASTESAQVSTKDSTRTVDTLYSSSPAFCATGEEYDEGDFSPDPVTISSSRVRGTPQSVQLRGQGVSVALIRENATLRKMVIDKELKIRNLMDQLRKGSTSIERVS